VEDKGVWNNALCVVQVYPPDNLGEKKSSRKYPRVHLLEEWIGVDDLFGVLDQNKGIIKVDGEEVTLSQQTRLNEWQYLPSNNEFSNFPGYVYKSGSVQVAIDHSEPLLALDLPFYPEACFAMREWGEFKQFNRHSDHRIGTLQVFLPQCRSYFKEFGRTENTLQITISDPGNSELRVKGAWEYGDSCTPFEMFVASGTISVKIPDQVEGFEVYLMGADGNIYDFHRETRFWVLGQDRVLRDVPKQGTVESEVHSALQHGEGETTEFKPYIKKGDPKHQELVKTVIAFANTKGGMILIGIDDECIVVGVEKDILKQTSGRRCTRDEAQNSYIGWLRQSIAGKLNRSLALQISSIDVEGHDVILINVPQGQQRPYADVRTNVIYVRRGANNVIPHPDHELPELYKSSSEQQAMPWEQ